MDIRKYTTDYLADKVSLDGVTPPAHPITPEQVKSCLSLSRPLCPYYVDYDGVVLDVYYFAVVTGVRDPAELNKTAKRVFWAYQWDALRSPVIDPALFPNVAAAPYKEAPHTPFESALLAEVMRRGLLPRIKLALGVDELPDFQ